MKYCIDCKYYQYNKYGAWIYQQHICTYEDSKNETVIDVVTGESNKKAVNIDKLSCHTMRLDGEGYCGVEGKFWELKE